MGKYEQEFKAITEQIEASDSVSAFKDELIIAQERCDLLCQQEGAQAEILNLIQSLDQQWGRLNQKIYFSGEGLLITNQLNPEAISGREYDSGGVRDLVVVRVNFDNYPGVSEGFFIHTLPIRDSEGDIVGYKNSVLHRTRLDLPIVVNNTVFKEVYTEIENVDALTVGEDTEYLEYTAPELFEHICKCRESSTTIDEFLRQIADYGLDYHNFKGVTLAEVNKFLNREIKFSSTLPYIIRGVDYAYQKFDDSKSSEPGDSEQKIQYKSVPLDPAFYAYIDGLFVNSNSITASDGSGTYSRINFSLMAKVVINDETFKVVIPINKNISVIDPNDLL